MLNPGDPPPSLLYRKLRGGGRAALAANRNAVPGNHDCGLR